MTEAEYLAFEEQAEEKHEFDDGLVRPLSRLIMMAGGTIPHSGVITNTLVTCSNALRGTGCRVFDSNLAVKARNDPRYSYPDATIICGDPQGDPVAPTRIVNNPLAVIEVLSPGTERYDTTDKFDKYARIPSLREYVLIEHDRPRVQTLYRDDDGRWIFANFIGIDARVTLRSVGIELPMEELYRDVDLRETGVESPQLPEP